MKRNLVLTFAMLLIGAASLFGQNRLVIDQSSNAVTFSSDGTLWGLEVGGKVVFGERYKTVDFQDGLFKVENTNGEWNVCDASGNMKLKWIKATGVSISGNFVLFLNADGNKAISYNRTDWSIVQAQETTYENMADEITKRNAGKGLSIQGYESSIQKRMRRYNTQPQISSDGKRLTFRGETIHTGLEVKSMNNEQYGKAKYDGEYDSDGRLYFMFKSPETEKWGVVYFKEERPQKGYKAIDFIYEKIEYVYSGYFILNCYLADGTMVQRWFHGPTVEESPIPKE
jgi:hypothetical protein